MQKQKWTLQVMLAAILLMIGLLVYLFDRPADQIYFVPDWWTFTADTDQVFGSIGDNLPTFIHVVVFILISSALLSPWRSSIVSICFLWFGIDSLFELAQHDAVATLIADMVPNWFHGVIILENTANYFLAGTFDPLDLISIALGSFSAYLMIRCIQLKESDNEPKTK